MTSKKDKPGVFDDVLSRLTGVGPGKTNNIDVTDLKGDNTSMVGSLFKSITGFLEVLFTRFTDPESFRIKQMAFLGDSYYDSVEEPQEQAPSEQKPAAEPKLTYVPAPDDWKPKEASTAGRNTFARAASLEGIPVAQLYPDQEASYKIGQPTQTPVYGMTG